jgi:hypothetical protein
MPETVHQRESSQQVRQRPTDFGPEVGRGVQGVLHTVEIPNHQGEGSGVRDEERASLPENTSTCYLVCWVGVRRSVHVKKAVCPKGHPLEVARHQIRDRG